MAIELTNEEKIKAARAAGTIIGKSCIGIAKVLKLTGLAIGTTTKVVASGLDLGADALHYTAGGVRTGGNIADGFCKNQAAKVENYGNKYYAKAEEAADEVTVEEDSAEEPQHFDFTVEAATAL